MTSTEILTSGAASSLILPGALTLGLALSGCALAILMWKATGLILLRVGKAGFFPPRWVDAPTDAGSWPELGLPYLLLLSICPLIPLLSMRFLWAPEFLFSPLPLTLPLLTFAAGLLIRGALRFGSTTASSALLLSGAALLWLQLHLLGALAMLATRPERWALVGRDITLLLSPETFLNAALFGCIALLLLCLGSFYFRPPMERCAENFLSIAATMGLLALPPLLVLDLLFLPVAAISEGLIALAFAGTLLCLPIALALPNLFKGRRNWTLSLMLGTAFVILAVVATGRTLAATAALADYKPFSPIVSRTAAPPAPSPTAQPGEQAKEMAARAQIDEGEAIFNRVCSACHRWDSRVVGPALEGVLPEYREDRAALEAFLRSPQKVDPDFPPMPDPGLSDSEIEAVASYLLDRLEQEAEGR